MDNELTADQRIELEADLIGLRDSLAHLLQSTEAAAKPVKLKDNQGRLSRMDEMHNQSILLANRNVTKNRHRQVLAAINRLASGNYGYCAHCDEQISFQRLKAYPEASLCLQCKSAAES